MKRLNLLDENAETIEDKFVQRYASKQNQAVLKVKYFVPEIFCDLV